MRVFLICALSNLNDVSNVIAGYRKRLFILTAEEAISGVSLPTLTQVHRVSLKELQGTDIHLEYTGCSLPPGDFSEYADIDEGLLSHDNSSI